MVVTFNIYLVFHLNTKVLRPKTYKIIKKYNKF